MKKYDLIDNAARRRYEFRLGGGQTAWIDYGKSAGSGEITLLHTDVPLEWQGRGVGTALVKASLADIERQGLRLIPLCGFVRGYIVKHPRWQRLVPQEMDA